MSLSDPSGILKVMSSDVDILLALHPMLFYGLLGGIRCMV